MSFVIGGLMMVIGAGWWLSHAFDLEWSIAGFIAPIIFFTGIGLVFGGWMS